ncbi:MULTISPECIES: hypothetical protein [Burkholderia]|uniref:Uncharacterized protein n=1 Tax=Burkholderia contaminans TaxID=488447 RepID=A0A6P2W9N3_9BURK|nr:MULTISPECIES: hypothetical protein [Burkholderia]MDN7487542.1 hypothetical protein [Burkholderia sp. AU45274]VWC96628.1 hypothetical protein BCO71171_01535 [Burkholderia contaminans]
MPPIQYVNASDGTPTHVIIPVDEFERDYVRIDTTHAAPESEPARESLLSADKLFIKLPHGGPDAKIDVHAFAHAFCRRGTTDTVLPVVPIAKKTQKLADFEAKRDGNNNMVGPINGLDAMLRRCCLPEGSPYRDTMQATTAVVDALVETGLFKRTTQSMPGFYRAVQCLSVVEEKIVAFVDDHGEPDNPIDPNLLIIP